MTSLIEWLSGGAWQVIAPLLLAVFGGLGFYAKGKSDGRAKINAEADRAYRQSTERMQDAEADLSDDPAVLREQLRARDPGLR